MDVALLVLRVVIGLYLIGHGTQKLFGWFGGPGIAGTQGMTSSMGFKPPQVWAWAVMAAEAGGGLLLVLGLLNPLGSLGIIASMLVAIATVHLGKGFFSATGGPELPVTNVAVAVAVAIAGAGRFSLDSLFHIALPEPLLGIIFAVLTVAAVAAALISRRMQAAGSSEPSAA
jgi:putative oxidoreductase